MIEKILKVLRQVEEERRGIAVPQVEEARRIAELFEIKPEIQKVEKVAKPKKRLFSKKKR